MGIALGLFLLNFHLVFYRSSLLKARCGKMKITLFVFLIILGAHSYSNAQTFRIGNARTLKATAFDQKTKNIYAVWQDSVRIHYAPDYTTSRLIPIDPPEEYDLMAFLPICADSKLYLVNRSGGLVYQLEGNSFRRIDRSFDHKMQINSAIFTRNDTLMRYGGYGFWSDRNFFTYFNEVSGEWEIISPTGSDQLPKGSHNSELVQRGNYIYIFSGRTTDEFEPLRISEFREVWRFETNNKRWDYLGELSEDFHKYIEVLNLGDKILYGDPKMTRHVLVDPVNNELAYYEKSIVRQNIYHHNPGTNNIRSFYDEGRIYLVKVEHPSIQDPWDGELAYTIIAEEEFLGEPISSIPLYDTNGFPLRFAGSTFLIIGALVLVFYARKRYSERDKLVVSEKAIRYKGNKVSMDPISLQVLNLLLRSKGEVNSQEILNLVENPSHNPAHNVRVKNQVIENLNFRIKTLLGLEEDIIESRPSGVDKRIKAYYIELDYFNVR